MKIIHILDYKCVEKPKKVIEREEKKLRESGKFSYVDKFKKVKTKEPTYIIEMSAKEFQLVSFYLELEHRKPIMNVKVDAKLKENKDE